MGRRPCDRGPGASIRAADRVHPRGSAGRGYTFGAAAPASSVRCPASRPIRGAQRPCDRGPRVFHPRGGAGRDFGGVILALPSRTAVRLLGVPRAAVPHWSRPAGAGFSDHCPVSLPGRPPNPSCRLRRAARPRRCGRRPCDRGPRASIRAALVQVSVPKQLVLYGLF